VGNETHQEHELGEAKAFGECPYVGGYYYQASQDKADEELL